VILNRTFFDLIRIPDLEQRMSSPVHAHGQIIRRIRLSNGFTQKVVAQRAKLSLARYRRIENGKFDLELETIWAIAEALGVKASRIVRGTEKLLKKKDL
jgi:transcriptional regulator with XRE-family HTH domain